MFIIVLHKWIIGLFIVFGFYYVFLLDTISDPYVMVFKLIPMVLVILLAFLFKVEHIIPYKTLMIIALIFCAIGDYTLQWFIIGLISFLIGHIFYIRAFLSTKEQATPLWVKVILIVYGVIMLIWIGGTLIQKNELILACAVTIYMFVILTMGWTSFRAGSKYAVARAILFIISDSILAINKFVINVEFSHQLIMLTYYSAQLLMALSIPNYSAIRSNVIQ